MSGAREFPEVDFARFHRSELPERIRAGNGRHAFAACEPLGTCAFRTSAGEDGVPLAGHRDPERGSQ